MMRLDLGIEQIAQNGLEISVEGFAGDIGSIRPTQVYIEFYEGKLRVHVWDGAEDPKASIDIAPLQRDECSHGVRRDLCPDCSPDDMLEPDMFCNVCGYKGDNVQQFVSTDIAGERRCPKCGSGECYMMDDPPHVHTEQCWLVEDGRICGHNEPQPPNYHSHNTACYMLGQRGVRYRTCNKLEGEPE